MQPWLDIRTLFLVYGAVSFALAVPMLYTSFRRKTYTGFHLWTAAFIINGSGGVLLGLRHCLPDLFTVVIANTALVVHLTLIRRGILHFLGRRSRIIFDFLPMSVVLVTFSYFTYLQPDINIRIIVISTVLALVYMQNSLLLLKRHSLATGAGNRLLALTFLLAAGWFALRVFITLLLEDRIADFMTAGTFHGLTVIVFCLTSIISMAGLLTLNTQKLEVELRESEKQYRLLFTQSPIGLVQLDQKGVIVDLNEAFANIIGATREKLLGIHTLQMVQQPQMLNAIQAALSGRQGEYAGEYRSMVTGKTIFIRVLTRSIQSDDGESIGAIGIFEDITETQKTEQALRESEKLQGVLEMAGAVCHELNQPLMAILGNAELISLNISEADPMYKKTMNIAQQVARLRDLNQKLMGIARYETKSYLKGQIIDIEKASK